MAVISVAIAVRDEEGDLRKKQGDIIAVRPGGWQWGTKEVKTHLILEITLPPQATMDMAIRLKNLYLGNGVLNYKGSEDILAKRRFRIDWEKIKVLLSNDGLTVDWAKVEDVDVAYQPLSVQKTAPGGASVNLDPTKIVFDKYANRLVRADDFAAWASV